MKRYLLFDARCSYCTHLAYKICNETEDWINEVLALEDLKTKDLLEAANRVELRNPAIVEANDEETKVYTGFRLRWKLLSGLGLSRTWRIGRIIAGDLVTAAIADADEGATGRRRFITKAAGAGILYGLSVFTGLGFSRVAKAGNGKHSGLGSRWLEELEYEGTGGLLEDYDRTLAWTEFRYSYNVEMLLADTRFNSLTDARGLREVLVSNDAPEYFAAARHAIADADGEVLHIEAVNSGSLVVVSYALKNGHALLQNNLRLFQVRGDNLSLLAVLSTGRFLFKRTDGLFGPATVAESATSNSQIANPISGGGTAESSGCLPFGQPCTFHTDCCRGGRLCILRLPRR